MPSKTRYRERVFVGYDENGKKKYVMPGAYTKKELAAKVKQIKEEYKSALIAGKPILTESPPAKEEPKAPASPLFRDYALSWYRLYREPGKEKATKVMYSNVLKTTFSRNSETPQLRK